MAFDRAFRNAAGRLQKEDSLCCRNNKQDKTVIRFLKERSFIPFTRRSINNTWRVKKRFWFCVAKARGETRFVLNVLFF